MIANKPAVYNVPFTGLEEFEKTAAELARLGATHVMLPLPERPFWIWDRDRTDPYSNWGFLIATLFRLIVPEELKQWLPADYAARNLDMMKRCAEILARCGLKPALTLLEPFFLPEEVYRIHPDWRGPRCDHPRRSRNAYFAPCVDNPEVLALYRRTMADLCRQLGVDYFLIAANDSGSGLCWSSALYDGPNGPQACKHISPSQRIATFLSTLQQGAADAGVTARLETYSNVGIKAEEGEVSGAWRLLPDGIAVNARTNRGTPLTHKVLRGYYDLSPVLNIPLVLNFARQLEKAGTSPAEMLILTAEGCDFNEYNRYVEKYNARPSRGMKDRINLAYEVARDIVGDAFADELLSAWESMEAAMQCFDHTLIEGLSWCVVNQRWINRPFVLFPDELLPEERDYYRAYQFQATDEAHANDLLDCQCTTFIRGHEASFMATKSLNKAQNHWKAALSSVEKIAGGVADSDLADKLRLQADRLRLVICMFNNVLNAIEFQSIVDSADYSRQPEVSPRWPINAEESYLRFTAATRAEVDNTYEIIRLVQGRERQMLQLAPSPEKEDIFLLSPEIVGQLRHKAEIMMDHYLDGKRLFVTNNQ